MKIKKVIVFDYGNPIVFFIFSSLFDLLSSVFLLRFRPLAG